MKLSVRVRGDWFAVPVDKGTQVYLLNKNLNDKRTLILRELVQDYLNAATSS